MLKNTLICTMFMLSLVAEAPSVWAAPENNGLVAVEGRLTNLAGEAVAGPVDLTLGIYNSLDQQLPVWSKVWFDVPLANGSFQLLLGQEVPLDATWFEDFSSLWIGVAVEGGSELPRVPLTSVGYSFYSQSAGNAASAQHAQEADWAQQCDQAALASHADVADALNGFAPDVQCSGCVQPSDVDFNYAGSNSQGGAAIDLDCTGCVGTGDLAPGAVGLSNLASAGCMAGQMVKRSATGTSWVCANDSDTLMELTCSADAIPRYTPAGWSCDVDRVLTEGQVDAYANNNGYAASSSLQTVAFTGAFSDLLGVPAGLADGDNDTTYAAGFGITLDGFTFNVDQTKVQRRVAGYCAEGESIRSIGVDGTVICEVDDNSGGDITEVKGGTGLSGGATSGVATLTVDLNYTQRRVMGGCVAGESIRGINMDGTVSCEVDDNTTYLPGTALQLSGTTFNVNQTTVENWIKGVAFDSSLEIFGVCDGRYVAQGAVDSITSGMINDNSIGSSEVVNNSIQSLDITNGTIANLDIAADAAIDYSKLAGVAAEVHTHTATQVTAGTFPSGTFTFNGGTLNVKSKVVMNGCPSGYTYVTLNLCEGSWKGTPLNYMQAQASCHAEGAHICTFEEFYQIWNINGVPFSATGAWIGNIIADQKALKVNSTTNMDDFDVEANRTEVNPFKCCMGLGR